MAQAIDEKNDVPATMIALVCEKVGDPKDVLKLKNDVPVPKPADNEVLVKVLAAAVNPIDYKIINGSIPISQPPFIVGVDFAGRVVKKGSSDDLKEYELGDLVYGTCWTKGQGSFAEYCPVAGNALTKVPKNVDPLQAAAVPLVCNTSYQALQKSAVKAGEKLLILGGSTSTGLAAIQIAKNMIGCSEVIVTSSQEDLCKSVGADRVVNYRKEKWEDALKDMNLDAIYDCIGGQESWDAANKNKILKKDGLFVSIVGGADGKNGDGKYEMFMSNSTASVKETSKLVEEGKLKPVLDAESPFDLKDWAKAFEKSMSHKAKGKLVVKVAEK